MQLYVIKSYYINYITLIKLNTMDGPLKMEQKISKI